MVEAAGNRGVLVVDMSFRVARIGVEGKGRLCNRYTYKERGVCIPIL